MKFIDSENYYGRITQCLHWICALLIFFLFGLGVYMRGLDYYSTWYHRAPALHIALGLLVCSLMLMRLVWRANNQTPARIISISRSLYLAANATKIVLYVLTFAICISGYLITTADGQAANFFDLFAIPASIELSATHVDLAGKIHKYTAWSLIAIALAHGGAALFHHFIKRDATLLRMLKTD
jgi:cytochrome b561